MLSIDHLVLVTVNHKCAPLRVVWQLAPRIGEAYEVLSRKAQELVVLSTCARFEVYALAEDPEGFEREALKFLGSAASHALTMRGIDAARHLLRVAAGLETVVLGEPEILGQVVRAYEEASRRGAAGKMLGLLFQYAVRAGKRVRSETSISRGSVGLPGAAVTLAEKVLGGLRGRRVVVVGAGEAGAIMASQAARRGARVVVVSRHLERAREVAARVGGGAASLESLAALLRGADALLVATTGGVVVRREHLEGCSGLTVVDISTPPAVELPTPKGVRYYGFEDVRKEAERAVERREAEVEKAERVVEEVLESLSRAWRRRAADEVLATLFQYAEEVAKREAEELLRALASRVPVDGLAELVDAFARSLVKKVLRPVVVMAREASERGELEPLLALEPYLRREASKLGRR